MLAGRVGVTTSAEEQRSAGWRDENRGVGESKIWKLALHCEWLINGGLDLHTPLDLTRLELRDEARTPVSAGVRAQSRSSNRVRPSGLRKYTESGHGRTDTDTHKDRGPRPPSHNSQSSYAGRPRSMTRCPPKSSVGRHCLIADQFNAECRWFASSCVDPACNLHVDSVSVTCRLSVGRS